MMKLGFALSVLFYLCYSVPVRATINVQVNKQMIDTMRALNDNVIFPPNHTLTFPGNAMLTKAKLCVGIFIRELKKIIGSVTTTKDHSHELEKLEANLKLLEEQQGNTHNSSNLHIQCKLDKKNNTSLPFSQYIKFLKRLNRSKN